MKLKQTHMPGEKVQTHTKYRELLSLSVSSSKSLEKKKALILRSFITNKHYSVSENSFLALETSFRIFYFLVV